MQAAQVSFPDWRKEVPSRISGEDIVIYITKISKVNVIPIYRLADPTGETQDVVCYLCDSFDSAHKEYTKKEIFPAYHIHIAGQSFVDHGQMNLDMIHNCNALGIEIQDGVKQDGWKQFIPIITNKGTIPMDDLLKYYKKEDTPTLVLSNEEKIKKTLEAIAIKDVTTIKKEEVKIPVKINTEKVVIDPNGSVSLNEPAHHFVPQPKGQRGRPKKVYDDPVFDALVKSIPHSVACKGCGKDIIIAPLNIIDRAKALKVEVSAMLSDYRCRSCK